MTPPNLIRESTPEDVPQLEKLYPRAFPEEDLLPVVRALLAETEDVMSLVACESEGGTIIGHVIFTICGTDDGARTLALLAPLGVDPDHQRCGVGSALVHEGFVRLKALGMARVFVLGDPAYYSRFGFRTERSLMPPYQIPAEWAEAWQSLALRDGGAKAGTLDLPEPWLEPKLWLP